MPPLEDPINIILPFNDESLPTVSKNGRQFNI